MQQNLLDYKAALKAHNVQANAADSLARLTGLQAAAIFNWGNKFSVNLSGNGHILCGKGKQEFLNDVIDLADLNTKSLLKY